MKEYTRNIGQNRGKTRIWLEGKLLLEHGWNRGDTFNAHFDEQDGAIHYVKISNGTRKVAGTPERPIIDTNTPKVGQTLGQTSGAVKVSVNELSIHIQGVA